MHKKYVKNTKVRNFLSDIPRQSELYKNIINWASPVSFYFSVNLNHCVENSAWIIVF